ncbi:hypothetical protein [Xanthomonas oryzae]|uniref:hypothetical protein n=1 Tax=Xanthomonas oryzae TaxID=347 RepID=UPI0021DA4291|nr:hypothetical protein [Xanthomonas oryzae]
MRALVEIQRDQHRPQRRRQLVDLDRHRRKANLGQHLLEAVAGRVGRIACLHQQVTTRTARLPGQCVEAFVHVHERSHPRSAAASERSCALTNVGSQPLNCACGMDTDAGRPMRKER